MFPSNPPHEPISLSALIAVAFTCLATWALSHSYLGLFHDAGLYTLQALAHLHPETLKQDVFLRFGSQDRFTVFSPIYAGAARWLGVEPAASLLTLISQLALLAGAYAMAKTLFTPTLSFLGVAAVLAIPGYYGAERIFTFIEPFLTPRMAAEALTLGSLAATLASRHVLSAILIAAAVLLHPVMAAAGLVALLCLHGASRHPRAALIAAAAAMALLTLQTIVMPMGPLARFDPAWLSLVQHRSPYLFLGHWDLDDWSRVAVTLSTLTLACGILPAGRARALSRALLPTVLGGFVLTGIACDLLHSVLVIQVQPWRWEWLGSVVAAILLPQMIATLWSRKDAGRSSAMMLIAAWLFAANVYALTASLGAVAAIYVVPKMRPNETRWIVGGACSLLAIALVWRIASNLQFTDAYSMEPGIPLWIRRSISLARDGTIPFMLIAAVLWVARHRTGRVAVPVVGVLSFVLCCALAKQTWAAWTSPAYPPARFSQFAALRAQIPAGSDVFWPESPIGVWILIDRPSYLSVIQTSGMIFSRNSALELNRRAQQLGAVISPAYFMDWSASGTALSLSRGQLIEACATGGFKYLVTAADLGTAPLAAIQSATGPTTKKIRLYHCGT